MFPPSNKTMSNYQAGQAKITTETVKLNEPNLWSLLLTAVKRPFPSCSEPHYESEAKCKAFHI